ncbi:hypothetical protein A4H97_19950 [Niastella yeongjuensis]|uniref:Uncharacterized protein n=1 Tax=Niastella yeongjuensis TaxID=354355 RepID=A0A1V9FBU6_9BACT|nr:hypothetical protein [Niastella yeongjuensis]OQP55869.1 hypothetical protein A4H97_19950 [Niastella yeongjuensis]SEP47228.1 hypothetical protein SAMN05660816_06558 [Niastella yeongjuensis]
MKRKKTPLNRKRVLTDPAFEMTRQNSAEFSRAGRAARLLHKTLAPGLHNTAHQYISGRLTKTMFKVLQGDLVNNRGERRVPQGMLSTLKGFNFNRDTSLQNVLKAPYSVIFDLENMQATISFPSFIPKAMIDTASGANAFRLTAMAVSLDLEKGAFPVEPVRTDIFDLALQHYENLQLHMQVIEHQPDNSVVVALGIEFFIGIQGIYDPVNKKHNPLAIAYVF